MMTRLCGPLGGALISHKPVDNFANAVNVIYAHRFPFPRIPSHERFFPRNETIVEIFFKVLLVIDRCEMKELHIRNILSAKRIRKCNSMDEFHRMYIFFRARFFDLSLIKPIDKS